MKADRHYWRTADGRYVETGHLDAETLAYPAGSDLPDEVARAVGLLDEPKKAKAAPAEDKQAQPSQTKQRSRSADK